MGASGAALATICAMEVSSGTASPVTLGLKGLVMSTMILPASAVRQRRAGRQPVRGRIIGSGNMASAIGALAVKGGNAVEVMGRNAAKAAALARALGKGATAGTWGAAPAGEIVILAVQELVTVPREVHASNLDPPTSQNPAHYVALLTGMIYPSIPERRLP